MRTVVVIALIGLTILQIRLLVANFERHAPPSSGQQGVSEVPDDSTTMNPDALSDLNVVRTIPPQTLRAVLVRLSDDPETPFDDDTAARLATLIRANAIDAELPRSALLAYVTTVLRADQLEYLRSNPVQSAPSDEPDPAMASAIAVLGRIATVDPGLVAPAGVPVVSGRSQTLLMVEDLANGLAGIEGAPRAVALTPQQAATLLPALLGYYQAEKSERAFRNQMYQILNARQRAAFVAAALEQREAARSQAPPPGASTEQVLQKLECAGAAPQGLGRP